MKFIVPILLMIFSTSISATTLRNVTLDEVVAGANEVMMLRIVEAKLLKVDEAIEDEIVQSSCGINVKAEVIHNYGVSGAKVIEFTTMKHVEVGSSYFSILNEYDSKKWFASMFRNIRLNGRELGSHPKEINCLKHAKSLKALAFPQRIMKYDNERWLDVSLNNIVFPAVVLVEAESEQSVIAQYNKRKVDYHLLHDYLVELAESKNGSNKSKASDKPML
ncbi:hypothetical protein [Pleionea sediminis]|uniref:hypothetical protein n=1 Tax=Pleionea sediminis TaxID=2569479 RepID=UPI001185BF60|nr:hypothetical protein [Pleionea sediminis]